jgi:hypothetical protein
MIGRPKLDRRGFTLDSTLGAQKVAKAFPTGDRPDQLWLAGVGHRRDAGGVDSLRQRLTQSFGRAFPVIIGAHEELEASSSAGLIRSSPRHSTGSETGP